MSRRPLGSLPDRSLENQDGTGEMDDFGRADSGDGVPSVEDRVSGMGVIPRPGLMRRLFGRKPEPMVNEILRSPDVFRDDAQGAGSDNAAHLPEASDVNEMTEGDPAAGADFPEAFPAPVEILPRMDLDLTDKPESMLTFLSHGKQGDYESQASGTDRVAEPPLLLGPAEALRAKIMDMQAAIEAHGEPEDRHPTGYPDPVVADDLVGSLTKHNDAPAEQHEDPPGPSYLRPAGEDEAPRDDIGVVTPHHALKTDPESPEPAHSAAGDDPDFPQTLDTGSAETAAEEYSAAGGIGSSGSAEAVSEESSAAGNPVFAAPVIPPPALPSSRWRKGKGGGGRGSLPPKGRSLPIKVIIGWVGESAKSDVYEHARGIAEDHFETLDTAWIVVEPFLDGHLYEIHEGGAGYGYTLDIIEELSRDPEQIVWVPSGTALNRVVTIRSGDGEIFSSILNEAESNLVRRSGQEPLSRTTRMRPVIKKGQTVFVIGGIFAAMGTLSLIVSAVYAFMISQQPIPSLPFIAENLPHRQITTLSDAIRDDRWVSRIIFENGQWRAEFQEVELITLPDDDNAAQSLMDSIQDEEAMRIQRQLEAIQRETQR